MKKILFVIPSMGTGGAEKYLLKILNEIDYTKVRVTLFLIYFEGNNLEEINKNVKIKYMFPKNGYKNIYLKKLYKYFRAFTQRVLFLNKKVLRLYLPKEKYDIEIAFLEGLSGRIVSTLKSKALKIAWIHSDMRTNNNFNLYLNDYKNINRIVCVNNSAKDGILYYDQRLLPKIQIINNFIEEMREKIYPKNQNQIEIVTIGRLSRVKGYDFLILSFFECLKKNENIQLKIIGDGEEEIRLKKMVKDLKIQEKVEFLGYKKNPIEFIKNAHIYVNTSLSEAMPLTILEAMSCGLPIIATNCPGNMELLNGGKYGKICQKKDIVSLKESILEFIEKEKEREKYSIKSLEKVKYFSKSKILNEIENSLLQKIFKIRNDGE